MKTVVIFQGGGALGAFTAGAWAVVGPRLRARGDEVVAVAGTSIGAFNAAIVAACLDAPDLGADALRDLWRGSIAQASLPFLGPEIGEAGWSGLVRSWNGLLTGLLVGNRALYHPRPLNWTPWASMHRLDRPLHDPSPMGRIVERTLGRYRSDDPGRPLLAAGATDVERGELRLLHSDERAIGPPEVLASAAIPMLFAPVEIDGRRYWDGDLVRDSLMAPLWAQLQASGRLAAGEPTQLVTIEQYAQEAAIPPRSSLDLTFHLMSLLQSRKLEPAGIQAAPGGGRWIRIARRPAPHDAVSREFDYSPTRIEQLTAQGEAAATAALAQAGARLR